MSEAGGRKSGAPAEGGAPGLAGGFPSFGVRFTFGGETGGPAPRSRRRSGVGK